MIHIRFPLKGWYVHQFPSYQPVLNKFHGKNCLIVIEILKLISNIELTNLQEISNILWFLQ